MKKKEEKKHGIFWAIGTSILLQLLLGFIFALVYSFTKSNISSYFFGYLFTLILIIIIFRKKLINDLKSFKQDIKGNTKKIIIAFIILTLFVYISNIILYLLFGTIADNEEILRNDISKNILLMFFPICIFGPIIEEITFRYPYKDIKTNKTIAFITYTTIFALLHLSVANNLIGLLYIIPYWLLSASFSYSFYKTNNIYTSIIFHTLNNIISYIFIIIGG